MDKHNARQTDKRQRDREGLTEDLQTETVTDNHKDTRINKKIDGQTENRETKGWTIKTRK